VSDEPNPIAVAIWTRHLSNKAKPMTLDITKRIDPILADHRMTRDEYTSLLHHLVDRSARDGATEERERIAELERDNNAMLSDIGKLNDECGTLDIVQVAPLVADLRANLTAAHKEIDTLRAELAALKEAMAGHNTPVVEEQGPWVIYDAKERDFWRGGGGRGWTNDVEKALRLPKEETRNWAGAGYPITLAEARELAAKVTP